MMAAAGTTSLCYCVHKQIEQSEEIMTVVEVKGFFEGPLGGGASAVAAMPDEERNKKLDSEDSQGEIEQHWPQNLNIISKVQYVIHFCSR